MTTKSLTVPDIVNKGQRVLRTIVQVGIPAFLAFALVLPQIIESLGLPVDSALRLWLVGAAAVVTAVAAALTRIMAIPAVNLWLTHFGLGSVPKAVAQNSDGSYTVTSVPAADAPTAITEILPPDAVSDPSDGPQHAA